MNAEQAQKRRAQGGVQHSTPVMEALEAREKAISLPFEDIQAARTSAKRFMAHNSLLACKTSESAND